MGNQYLSQEIYNEKFKNEFLEQYKSKDEKKTSNAYRYIFQKSFNTETRLGKDIYEFNDQELDKLIHSYPNGSVYVVSSNISILRQYLDYCIAKGEIRVNLLQDLSGYDDFMKYVDKNTNENKYIDRYELERIIDACINYQDKYSIAMLWYGFKGEDYCEITNLKKSDINQDNMTIYIENRDLTYEIDEYLMEIIVGAMNQTWYQKTSKKGKDKPYAKGFKIFQNDYVMKVANNDVNEPVSGNNVGARLTRVKTYTGNPYIIPNSIWYSGLLDQARQIQAEKGEVEKEDWISLGELYGIPKLYWTKTRQRFDGLLEPKVEKSE